MCVCVCGDLPVTVFVSCRNCLFRALGDQLEGHSRGHLRLRQETVQFMMSHRQDFEPFVEDDIPFSQHCKKLQSKNNKMLWSDRRLLLMPHSQWTILSYYCIWGSPLNWVGDHFDQQKCSDPWWSSVLFAMELQMLYTSVFQPVGGDLV